MKCKVETKYGPGFLIDYAMGGRLAFCMILTGSGWISRHILTENVVFLDP